MFQSLYSIPCTNRLRVWVHGAPIWAHTLITDVFSLVFSSWHLEPPLKGESTHCVIFVQRTCSISNKKEYSIVSNGAMTPTTFFFIFVIYDQIKVLHSSDCHIYPIWEPTFLVSILKNNGDLRNLHFLEISSPNNTSWSSPDYALCTLYSINYSCR